MSDFLFDKDAYLTRINFKEEVSNDFEFIKSILQAQHRTIPFENFDICLGKGINLAPDALFQKLVKNKRGGYCHELNGLFLLALEAFGFQARALLGRVHLTNEPTGRGHQITLVTIDKEKWLLDIGFGSETPPIPIPLIPNTSISFKNQTFRLIKYDLHGFMLQSQNGKEWKNLYSFDLSLVYPEDLNYANYYTSTNPKSFFVQARVAAIPIDNGIKSLYNMILKKRVNDNEETIILKEDQSYLDTIKQEFGIVLDTQYQDFKPLE